MKQLLCILIFKFQNNVKHCFRKKMICYKIVLLIGLFQLAQISLGQKVKIVNVDNLPSDIDLDVALFENLILVDENHPHIKQLIDVYLVPYLHLIDEKFKTTSQTKISFKKAFDNQPVNINFCS